MTEPATSRPAWHRAVARVLVWTMVLGNSPSASRPLHPALALSAPPAPPAPPVLLSGPAQYLRYAGPTNVYTASLAVPPWVVGPFVMHVQNGEPDGTFRLSSATIQVNGVEVAARGDFSQQIGGFDRTLALAAANSFVFSLDSVPEGRIYVSVLRRERRPHRARRRRGVAARRRGDWRRRHPRARDLPGRGRPGRRRGVGCEPRVARRR